MCDVVLKETVKFGTLTQFSCFVFVFKIWERL